MLFGRYNNAAHAGKKAVADLGRATISDIKNDPLASSTFNSFLFTRVFFAVSLLLFQDPLIQAPKHVLEEQEKEYQDNPLGIDLSFLNTNNNTQDSTSQQQTGYINRLFNRLRSDNTNTQNNNELNVSNNNTNA